MLQTWLWKCYTQFNKIWIRSTTALMTYVLALQVYPATTHQLNVYMRFFRRLSQGDISYASIKLTLLRRQGRFIYQKLRGNYKSFLSNAFYNLSPSLSPPALVMWFRKYPC